MVNNALDFGVILEKCGVGKETSQVVIKKLSELDTDLSASEIIELYEYILGCVKDSEVLSGVIKLADAYRDKKILSKLLDILLLKTVDNTDADNLINTRVLCAKAIANYKDTSTVGALLYCLNNKGENYKIRLACADALGRIGDKYALGMLGDVSAIDPLVSIMEAKQGLLGKFSFLKERIVEALGKLNINNSKVLKVLKNALYDSSPMVRINAIEALMNSDYEEAPELIRTALKDEDDEVKRNALIALYNIIGRDILDEVISLPGYNEFLKTEARNIIEEYEEVDE